MDTESFYVIARQPGAENPSIPTWANRNDNPALLTAEAPATATRHDIEAVPGAFQLLDVLSDEECVRLVELTESIGYLEDAAVSLPRSIRHNHSATWVADDATMTRLWQRCAPHIDTRDDFAGKRALGLNGRLRFYRYREGDFFGPHTDGSWPGSRVVDGVLLDNAFDDRWSQLTWLLFLSDDYSGGETRFFINPDDRNDVVDLRTPRGGVLCFPHGMHPLHCVHGSVPIEQGSKYIIRSDVLFEL